MKMAFDPFAQLDLDFDQVVDVNDLKMYSFKKGFTFSTHDLNFDHINDMYQHDLDLNFQFDDFQADINYNAILDQFDKGQTKFNHDINHSNSIDTIDAEIAKVLFDLR